LAADADVEVALALVEALQGGDVLVDLLRVVVAGVEDEHPGLGADALLEGGLVEGGDADEVDVADADVGPFDDLQGDVAALCEGLLEDADAGEGEAVASVEGLESVLGQAR